MKNLLVLLLVCASAHSFSQINHCIVDRYGNEATFDSLDIEREVFTFSIEERWPSTTMDTLKMEVFKPSSTVDPLAKRPLILMVHGGSFLAGTREEMNYFCMEMARRGYVTATIDYRLGWDCSSGNPCFGCTGEAAKLRVAAYRAVQDTRAAMHYLVGNADLMGIDTSVIFIQGTSAGSITALHTTFWDQTEANTFCTTCVAEVGSLDATGLAPVVPYTIKGVVNNCGGINNVAIMDGAQIPIISFHDEGDCVVPITGNYVINCTGCNAFFYAAGSQYITNNLNNNNVCSNMNTVPFQFPPQHCSYPANAIIGKASCFLKSILCDNCTTTSTTLISNIPDCAAGTTSVGLPTPKLNNVRIFPNPSKGELQIRTYSTEAFTVQLISMDGRLMKTISDVQNEEPISLGEFNSGIYSLRIIQSNGEFITRKIVLEK